MQPDSSLVRLVKEKYLKNDVDKFFSAKKNSASSTAWKSILGQRYLIKKFKMDSRKWSKN